MRFHGKFDSGVCVVDCPNPKCGEEIRVSLVFKLGAADRAVHAPRKDNRCPHCGIGLEGATVIFQFNKVVKAHMRPEDFKPGNRGFGDR